MIRRSAINYDHIVSMLGQPLQYMQLSTQHQGWFLYKGPEVIIFLNAEKIENNLVIFSVIVQRLIHTHISLLTSMLEERLKLLYKYATAEELAEIATYTVYRD